MRTDVPNVSFMTRVPDSTTVCNENGTSYTWENVTTESLFKGKKTLLFSLPGAFTPTCSTFQLPGFEAMHPQFRDAGVDEIYCMSVNDSFVMNAWAKANSLENVKVLPDGSGQFTRQMGMLVNKDNIGFGQRSWRYAVLIDDMEVVQSWVEPGYQDNANDDPYGETAPKNILDTMVPWL